VKNIKGTVAKKRDIKYDSTVPRNENAEMTVLRLQEGNAEAADEAPDGMTCGKDDPAWRGRKENTGCGTEKHAEVWKRGSIEVPRKICRLGRDRVMAIRNVREIGDEVLTKKCRAVVEMTPRIKELIEDMLDTMYEAGGVGLAAPQVGVLKRIVVIDVTGDDPHVLINPRIVETSGEQAGQEACLSVPGKSGQVTRPNYAKVVALDVNMTEFELEGTELLARAICHELDHLDGHLYVEKLEGPLQDVNYDEEEK